MSQPAQSVSELQAQIEAAQQRLASTIDELAFRTKPQELVRRQTESAKAGYEEAILLDERGFVCEGSGENIFVSASRTPDGALRMDRVAIVAAVVVALLGLVVSGRRRRRRG